MEYRAVAKIKILVVGDPRSIHANRFVELLQELNYDVRVFQSAYEYSLEEHLRDAVVYVDHFTAPPANGNRLQVCFPFEMGYNRLVNIIHLGIHRGPKHFRTLYGKTMKLRPRHLDLIKVVTKWKPDVVFSLKMQNDGYTVSEAKECLRGRFKPAWVHFNWGTDIEFFGKHPDYVSEHLPKIIKVLSLCDFHMADCKRDVRQAREFGFSGISVGDCLASGGFDLVELQRIRLTRGEERNVILVKGREGDLVGKAFNVLIALHRVASHLKGLQIKIIMPTDDVRGAAGFLARLDGLDCEVMPRLPYRELLALYARSRMAISASDVDGTPSFLIEAMAMGALPIHSDMESVREWVNDGINGLLFPVDDIEKLANCVVRAMKDDHLVASAQEHNWEIAVARMDRKKIRSHVRSLVEERILGGTVSA